MMWSEKSPLGLVQGGHAVLLQSLGETRPHETSSPHFCPLIPLQTTLLPLAPLYLKSGMLHTLCDLSSLFIPLSTSSETVLRSFIPVPSAKVEVRPTVLPNGLILIRDLKFMLMERLLFHWRAKRWASCSSFRLSRASMRMERKRLDTSCTSGSLACIASLNLHKTQHGWRRQWSDAFYTSNNYRSDIIISTNGLWLKALFHWVNWFGFEQVVLSELPLEEMVIRAERGWVIVKHVAH